MTTPKVEVIYFQKPCPHCKEGLFRIEKMSASWLECRNEACPYIVNQVPEVKTIRGVDFTSDPYPFTCGHMRR